MNENKELIQFCLNVIEKRIGNFKCPLCGNTSKNDFRFSEQFYHILSMTEGEDGQTASEDGQTAWVQLKMPFSIMRAVPVVCNNCGHVMFFNFDVVKGEI